MLPILNKGTSTMIKSENIGNFYGPRQDLPPIFMADLLHKILNRMLFCSMIYDSY